MLDLRPGLVVIRYQGTGVRAAFAPEAGGHRTQRVPPTEKRGRVQSSTVTVSVLPEPTEAELRIAPHELKYETYRGSGPGGQHRNKTESAVRVTHLPTGVSACSETKCQHRNRELALRALRSRIAQAKRDKDDRARNDTRRAQVGTAMRSDKIRTIAYQRGRVENHLNGRRASLDRWLKGWVEDVQ